MNYDSGFRSYNSVFHGENTLFMQHELRLFELNLKGTNSQHSGQTSQNIQN